MTWTLVFTHWLAFLLGFFVALFWAGRSKEPNGSMDALETEAWERQLSDQVQEARGRRLWPWRKDR